MRKVFFVLASFSLSLFIFTGVIAKTIESTPSSEASPTPAPSIEYFLPYPGILPDHPLYPIKALRDKILSILISDSVKRVEFSLLIADKRLNMGIFLSEKGKEELAETTVSKGEKYLNTAVDQFSLLKNKENGPDALLDKLKKSSIKHEEVIKSLKKKAAQAQQDGYESSLNIAKQSREKAFGIK